MSDTWFLKLFGVVSFWCGLVLPTCYYLFDALFGVETVIINLWMVPIAWIVAYFTGVVAVVVAESER